MDTTTFFEARNWWAYVLRGIAAIVFGLLTWIFPRMALLALVLLFGAWLRPTLPVLAEGLAGSHRRRPRRGYVVGG